MFQKKKKLAMPFELIFIMRILISSLKNKININKFNFIKKNYDNK
jgi:hypothetical protein